MNNRNQFRNPRSPQPSYPPGPGGPQKPPHSYRGWVLVAIMLCYSIPFIFILADLAAMSIVPSSNDTPSLSSSSSSSGFGVLSVIGILLFIALNISIMLLDGRSFFTLFSRIQWRRLKGWQKIGLGFLYFGICIMPAIYLFFAVRYFLRARQQTLRQALTFWYRSKPRNTQIGIALGMLIFALLFAGLVGAGASYDRTLALQSLTPTATAQQVALSNNPTNSTSSQDSTTPTDHPSPAATITTVPTSKPSPSPRSHPTPKPTPKPTQPAPPPRLTITFTCASAVDYSSGQVCVHTLSGAALTITVTYCSGYKATSRSLQGTFYADGSGNYTWYWTPETKCRGPATADVNASWNGQSISSQDDFNVQ